MDLSEAGPVDRMLFRHIKSLMQKSKNKSTAYDKDTELLWAGQHYLLVRNGYNSGCREAYLWSREFLLLDRGNPEKQPMVELALAVIDPVHFDWGENDRRLMHTTDEYGGTAKFQNRRWCQALVAEMIAFVKEEDRTQPERERAQSTKFVTDHAFSQETVQLVKDAGFEISGKIEENGIPFPVGNEYSVRVGHYSGNTTSNTFVFEPQKSRDVEVRLKGTILKPDEFKILIEALAEISRRMNKRTSFYTRTHEAETT